jgi:two-component system, OmpR family, alkaline phosphatase synthesis response regulator PhoP
MKKTIFVVDDEKDIQQILKTNLEKEGYDVLTFSSAEESQRTMRKGITPDCIVLDIMMQGIDGYEYCRQLRSSPGHKRIPILFLSARTDELDRVLGLELGGDDYITKPFSIKEIKSRIKAVLRRTAGDEPEGGRERRIVYQGMELVPDHYSLTVDGADVELTKTEFNILYLFMSNPGKIFSRDNIIDSIRGHDIYVVDRTVDVHIMNLRKKVGRYKHLIKTFSGVGYGIKE